MSVNRFLSQQGKMLLENSRYAVFLAVLFACLPYTIWLSLAILSLVTLRKGWREGALLMMPVMTAYFAGALFSLPAMASVVNTLLTFMPGYLASCVLGITRSWRSVAGFFIMLAVFSALLLHWLMPEFIMLQYQFISAAINEIQPGALLKLTGHVSTFNEQIFANYLFGLQMLGIIFSSVLSVLIARSIQSQLYYPGGFRQEMQTFRASKLALSMLVLVAIAVKQDNLIAMNIIPSLAFYFLLAGLSLCADVLSKKKMRGVVLVLLIPIFFLPFIMIPVYVILGSLDSLINLRLYLPSRAGKTR